MKKCMELDFSQNTFFSQKSKKKTNFLQKMHFWLITVPSFEKKKQIVFKKITSILFLQISKQTSCENPIQIHQEMVYLCYFEDDNVLKWEKQVWSFYNRQSYLERATNKFFFFYFLVLNLGFLLLVHESTHIKGAFEQEKWKWSKITNWAISWCKPSLKWSRNILHKMG